MIFVGNNKDVAVGRVSTVNLYSPNLPSLIASVDGVRVAKFGVYRIS